MERRGYRERGRGGRGGGGHRGGNVGGSNGFGGHHHHHQQRNQNSYEYQDHHQRQRRPDDHGGFQRRQTHSLFDSSHDGGRRCGTGGAGPGKGENSRRGREVWIPNRGGVPVPPYRPPFTEPFPDSFSQEIQSVTLSEKLPPSSSTPKNTSKRFPVTRPDEGGTLAIHTARLRVNHFLVKFSVGSTIMHYDINIRQEVVPENSCPGKISKLNMTMIRKKLFTDNPIKFPLSATAYDGEKNIYSLVPLEEGVYKVELSEVEDSRIRVYMCTIKLVNELKLHKLRDYLTGNVCTVPRDILQGMDVVMKENPTKCMISAGRGFHFINPDPDDDLGFGLTASRGYRHSLKPTSQGLALCVDYSVLAFWKKMPVIEFLKQHIHRFSLNNFNVSRNAVANALTNLKVTVTHRKTKQKYTIVCLTKERTKNIKFNMEDPDGKCPKRQVSIVDYFREKYGRDIVHKDIPCLDLGKNNRASYVPMEFCVLVEGQIYPKEQLHTDAAWRLKNMSLAKPEDRESRICKIVGATDGPYSGYGIRNFGIEVDVNMTSVIGRIIRPPDLKLGAPDGRLIKVTVDRKRCQWNLLGKGVVEGKPVERWAVLDFSSSDRCRLNADLVIPKLINRCRTLGMHMKEPVLYQRTGMDKLSNTDDLYELLESVISGAYYCGGGHVQFILCVMSRKDPGYKYLKWISETRTGVVTQCCLSTSANKVNDQYLANLALKINAKLGGSNVELVDAPAHFKREDHVMFVGADVNHPAARNTTSPSIAAVVATINWPAANQYAARIRAQNHREERIVNYGSMCLDLAETYARLNKGVKPKKVVVFRDGVSEGQFDMVLNEELLDMKDAFQKVSYFPNITIVVAQKRHQTRFFPESEKDGGLTGNIPPGTVVDTKIIHPFEFDFYLCSHYGSIGTSKPTHYHVLWDENGFSSDQLQKLIYDMCFTFARCTKSVSLIPPVYYADLVAYRGRLYHEAVIEKQSPPSAISSSSTLTMSSLSAEESFDEKFYKVHADLENIMFFV